jgi:hypothetical protein
VEFSAQHQRDKKTIGFEQSINGTNISARSVSE